MKNILEIKYHKTVAFLAISFGFFCVVRADYKAIKKQQRADIKTETREDYIQSKLPPGARLVDTPVQGIQKKQQEEKQFGITADEVRATQLAGSAKPQKQKELAGQEISSSTAQQKLRSEQIADEIEQWEQEGGLDARVKTLEEQRQKSKRDSVPKVQRAEIAEAVPEVYSSTPWKKAIRPSEREEAQRGIMSGEKDFRLMQQMPRGARLFDKPTQAIKTPTPQDSTQYLEKQRLAAQQDKNNVLPQHKQKASQAKNAFDKLPESAKKKWNSMNPSERARALVGIGLAATVVAGLVSLIVLDATGEFDTNASEQIAAQIDTENQTLGDAGEGESNQTSRDDDEEETVPVGAGRGYEFF